MKRIALAMAAVIMISLVGGGTRAASPCDTCGQSAPGLFTVTVMRPCPSKVLWNTDYHYTSRLSPACTPVFASGLIVDTNYPEPITVVRLAPIPVGPPKEPAPQRPITDPPVRPRRPMIEIPDAPPVVPPAMPDRDKPPVKPEPTNKLFVLLLVDDQAKAVGKANAAGADLVTALIRDGVRKERLGDIVRRGSNELTPEAIREAVKALPAQSDDAVFVYYAGPAEYDENAMGFVLTPGGKKLPREDLRKAIEVKGVRFSVLLTDPAAHPAILDPTGKPDAPNPGTGALDGLFFGYKGVVDVHAASVGEFAAARGNHGGAFTIAFAREFSRPAGGWADLLEGVKFTTNSLFKSYRVDVLKSDTVPAAEKAAYRGQESQTPAVLTPLDNITPVKRNGNGGAYLPDLSTNTQIAPVYVPELKPARIMVKLPADAKLFIDGEATTGTGSERAFSSTPIAVDQPRTFDLRVELNGWYGVYQATLAGGGVAMLELQVPAAVK